MSQIPQLMSGRALEHGIALAVDHGGTSSAKMHVGGQANADVAAGTVINGDGEGTTESETTEYKVPANTLVAGSTIRCKFYVHCPSGNGTDTTQVALRFGSNATASSNGGIESAAVDLGNSGDVIVGDGVLQVRTAGASGTAVFFGSFVLGTTVNALSHDSSGAMSELSINTTVDNFLSLTITLGSTNASMVSQAEAFIVDIVNPQT
tara:strand:- start:2138 stop:2758 length:621 start_codon:yes stop_codon:yes gene_type:complete